MDRIMASIRQRGPATWQIRVSLGRDAAGSYRYRSATLHGTRREAERRARLLQVEADEGRIPTTASSDMSFGEHLGRFTAWRKALVSPTTHARDRCSTKSLSPLHPKQVQSLTTWDFDALYAAMLDSGLSAATVAKVHHFAHVALNQAVKWGLAETNPTIDSTPPRVPRPMITPPSIADAQRLISASTGRFRLVLMLAIATGARRGELAALEWGDFDWTESTVTISKAMMPGGEIRQTKTGRSRTLLLDRATSGVLQRAPSDGGGSVAGVGRADSITQCFERLRRRVGLERVRFHDLRHLAASHLLTNGVDPVTVAARLGHSTPTTTLMIYGHPLAEADERAAAILGRAMHGQKLENVLRVERDV